MKKLWIILAVSLVCVNVHANAPVKKTLLQRAMGKGGTAALTIFGLLGVAAVVYGVAQYGSEPDVQVLRELVDHRGADYRGYAQSSEQAKFVTLLLQLARGIPTPGMISEFARLDVDFNQSLATTDDPSLCPYVGKTLLGVALEKRASLEIIRALVEPGEGLLGATVTQDILDAATTLQVSGGIFDYLCDEHDRFTPESFHDGSRFIVPRPAEPRVGGHLQTTGGIVTS